MYQYVETAETYGGGSTFSPRNSKIIIESSVGLACRDRVWRTWGLYLPAFSVASIVCSQLATLTPFGLFSFLSLFSDSWEDFTGKKPLKTADLWWSFSPGLSYDELSLLCESKVRHEKKHLWIHLLDRPWKLGKHRSKFTKWFNYISTTYYNIIYIYIILQLFDILSTFIYHPLCRFKRNFPGSQRSKLSVVKELLHRFD